MSSDDVLAVMNGARTSIGEIIRRPVLSDKLLVKPPFRFLHDIITAVIKSTGFAEGLFDEAELDSSKVFEEEAKIAYLEKIFAVVSCCKGEAVIANARKVVSGLESEKTCLFLIDLAHCARFKLEESAAAVQLHRGGRIPTTAPSVSCRCSCTTCKQPLAVNPFLSSQPKTHQDTATQTVEGLEDYVMVER